MHGSRTRKCPLRGFFAAIGEPAKLETLLGEMEVTAAPETVAAPTG